MLEFTVITIICSLAIAIHIIIKYPVLTKYYLKPNPFYWNYDEEYVLYYYSKRYTSVMLSSVLYCIFSLICIAIAFNSSIWYMLSVLMIYLTSWIIYRLKK